MNGFEEERVFCTADVFLDGNFYAEAKLKVQSIKGNQLLRCRAGRTCVESHEDLLQESPKFMKLHYGTKQEYQNAVRNNESELLQRRPNA